MLRQVGIVGYGTVGKALHSLFPDASIYDEPLAIGSRESINLCNVTFICVPTPNPTERSLDVRAVEEVVDWLSSDLIVIRSTVNPGMTDALKIRSKKRIVFQPEYLGETAAHPLADTKAVPFLILGGTPNDTRDLIELYQHVYNSSIKIRQTDALTAELIKLAENRAIAHKVLECQELFDLCQAAGVDYYVVREAVYQDDIRMSPYWTFVYNHARGFNSKCIPKDVHAITYYARALGAPLSVTEAVLKRNAEYLTNSDTL